MDACDNVFSFIHQHAVGWEVTHEDDLEQHLLVDLHELLVPLLDISGFLAGVRVVIGGGEGVILVVLTPLDDLLQDRLIYLWAFV